MNWCQLLWCWGNVHCEFTSAVCLMPPLYVWCPHCMSDAPLYVWFPRCMSDACPTSFRSWWLVGSVWPDQCAQWSLDIIVSPVRSTYGGYYGLVVVTPRPHFIVYAITLKTLSDCLHILYVDWYRWEDSWEARLARFDYLWAAQGPPKSQKYTFLYIVAHIWKTVSYFFPLLCICLLCDEV